jgi:hypothetical protein
MKMSAQLFAQVALTPSKNLAVSISQEDRVNLKAGL